MAFEAHKLNLLLEAIIFEQWIRFYWMVEDAEGDMCVLIPEDTMTEIANDYPKFKGMLERLDGSIVDVQLACSAILDFSLQEIGEDTHTLLESAELQTAINNFQTWLAAEGDNLDADPKDFTTWKLMFFDKYHA